VRCDVAACAGIANACGAPQVHGTACCVADALIITQACCRVKRVQFDRISDRC